MRSRGREEHGDSAFEDSFYNVDDGTDSRRHIASPAASTSALPAVTTAFYPVAVQPSSGTHQSSSRPTVIHTATNRPISTIGRPVVFQHASVEDEDGSFYNLNVPITELGSRLPTQQQYQVVHPTTIAQNLQQISPTTEGWLRNEVNTSTNNINSAGTCKSLTTVNRALLGSLTPAEINEIDALCGISSLIQLVEMGFPPEHCRMALKECDGDLSRATIFCLEHGPEEMQWLIRAEANRIARAASEAVDVEPTRAKPKKGLFQRLFASKSKTTPATNENNHTQFHASDGHGTQHAANRPLSTPVTAGHHPSRVGGAGTIAQVAAGGGATQSRTRAQTTTGVAHNTVATSRQINTPKPHNHTVPHPPLAAAQKQQRSQAPPPLQQHPESHVHYPPPMNPNFVDIPPSPPHHTYHNQQQQGYANQQYCNRLQNQQDFDDFEEPIPEIMQPPNIGGGKTAATAAQPSSNKRPISIPMQHSPANNNKNTNNININKPGSQQPSLHHDQMVSSIPHITQNSSIPASTSQSTFAPTTPTVTVAAPSFSTTSVIVQPSPTVANPPSGASSPHPRLAHALLDLPSTSHYGSLINIDAILQEQADAAVAPAQSDLPVSTTSSAVNKHEPISMPPCKPSQPASIKFLSNGDDNHDSSSQFGKTAFQNTSNFGLDIPTFGTEDSGFVFESERSKTNDIVVSEKYKAQLPHNPHDCDSSVLSTNVTNTKPDEQSRQSYFGSILFSDPFSAVEDGDLSEAEATSATVAPSGVSECDSFAPTVTESAATTAAANVSVESAVLEQISVETTTVAADNSHILVIIDSPVNVPVIAQASEVTVPEEIVPPTVSEKAMAKVAEEDSAVTDSESSVEIEVKPEQPQQCQELSEEVHETLVPVHDNNQKTVSFMEKEPFVESALVQSILLAAAQEESAVEIPETLIGEADHTQTIVEEASEVAVVLPQGNSLLFPNQGNEKMDESAAEQHVDVPIEIEPASPLDVAVEAAPAEDPVMIVSEDISHDKEIVQASVGVPDEQLLDATFQASQPGDVVQEIFPVPIAPLENTSIAAQLAPTEPRTQEMVAVDNIVVTTTGTADEEPIFDLCPEDISAVAAVTTATHTAVDDAFLIPEIAVADAPPHDDYDEFENFTPIAHSSSAAVEAEVLDIPEPAATNNVSIPSPSPLQLAPPSVASATAPTVVPSVAPATTSPISSNNIEIRPPIVLDRNHPPHLNSIDNILPTINIAAHSVIVTEGIPDSFYPSASPSVVGEQNGHEVSTSAAATTYISLLHKRQLQPYRIEPLRSGKFRAYVSMKQPFLRKNETSPQGNRPDEVILGDCANELVARDLCECFAPPIWQSKALHAASAASNTCTLCQVAFSMFSQPHHCRNCGFLVCGNCSDKFWPGTMLPVTFHDDEKMVRVCHSCHYLVENFVVALCAGDYQTVRALYATGNINLHQPYSVYTHQAYPVHYAVLGGNLDVLRWLIDVKRCSIINQLLKVPLVTQTSWTLLGLAAYCGHVDMIHFLVHQKKCQVSEIKEVITLQRAIHALLKAPGNLPEFVCNQKTNPQPSFALQALQDDLLLMLRHHPRLRSQPHAGVAGIGHYVGNDVVALNASTHRSNQAIEDTSHYRTNSAATTANAVPVNPNSQTYAIPYATAQEAPVIVASSTIEPAPIQINLLGIQTQLNVTVNSISQAILTKPLPKTRCLCSQAVFRVKEFLENQRRTMFYTLPPVLQHSNATGGVSETAGSTPSHTGNTSTSILGLSVPAGTTNNTGNDVVALASHVGGYPLTVNAAQHSNSAALAAVMEVPTAVPTVR